MKNAVPLMGFKCNIRPIDIFINPDAPVGLEVAGALGNWASDRVAVELVYASQKQGIWVGVAVSDRVARDTEFGHMIEHGHMVEVEFTGGWLYHLSLLAVTTIALHSAEARIRELESERATLSRRSFWDFIFPGDQIRRA